MLVSKQQIPIEDYSPPRMDGLHLSTLIQRRTGAEDAWIADDQLTELERQERLGLFTQGFLFEQVVEPAYARLNGVSRIDNMVCDGIVLNPDGFVAKNGTVYEYKATRKSFTTHLEGRERWLWQIMAYCYALQCTQAVLVVLYLNGNYRDQRMPVVWKYKLEFPVPQLQENWRVLKSYIKPGDKLMEVLK